MKSLVLFTNINEIHFDVTFERITSGKGSKEEVSLPFPYWLKSTAAHLSFGDDHYLMTLSCCRTWWPPPPHTTAATPLHLFQFCLAVSQRRGHAFTICLLLCHTVRFCRCLTQMEFFFISKPCQMPVCDKFDSHPHTSYSEGEIWNSPLDPYVCNTEWTQRPSWMHGQLLFVATTILLCQSFPIKETYGRVTFGRTQSYWVSWNKKLFLMTKTSSVFSIKKKSLPVTRNVRTKSIKDRQLLSLDDLSLISHDRLSGVLCNNFILLPLVNTSLFPDELSSTKHLIGHKWLHHPANDFISSSHSFVSGNLIAEQINLFPLKITSLLKITWQGEALFDCGVFFNSNTFVFMLRSFLGWQLLTVNHGWC